MISYNFSDILYRACNLCGFDRSTISDATFRLIRDFASQRISYIWDQEPWPDLVRVSTETVLTASDVKYIDMTAAMGDIIEVYSQNPRTTTRAVPVSYYLADDGTNRKIIFLDNIATVYVEYRIPKTELLGSSWSASATYAVGAQVYFDTSTGTGAYQPSATAPGFGNFYTCIVPTTAAQSPTTTPASWSLVQIPYFTGEYIIRGVLADYLRSERQFESAQSAEGDAEVAKMLQVDRVLRLEGQVRLMNVSNY